MLAAKRDYSLRPHYYDHSCRECGRFKREFPDLGGIKHENYCIASDREVAPARQACRRFSFHSSTKKKPGTSESEGEELLAQKMINAARKGKDVVAIQGSLRALGMSEEQIRWYVRNSLHRKRSKKTK
jgi:hypothetical protein